jgi:hypothetical protein
VPSARFAAAQVLWVFLVCAVTVFALALPLWWRATICIAVVVANLFCLSQFVLLRGRRAVRAIEWTNDMGFTAVVGPHSKPLPAQLAAGSFRLGLWLVVLRLRTSSGLCQVLIDGSLQDSAAFRALCLQLSFCLRSASRRRQTPS